MKWEQHLITVSCMKGHDTPAINALCCGGLALHAHLGFEPSRPDEDPGFTVTHITSGAAVCVALRHLTIDGARRFAETLLANKAIDWHLDGLRLVTDPDVKRFVLDTVRSFKLERIEL
ncbi:MAG: hypothetical protein JSS75_07335 [Bacteroidetes bacterium]|nr:hypothetical protein [Bacteroidota bacterium]